MKRAPISPCRQEQERLCLTFHVLCPDQVPRNNGWRSGRRVGKGRRGRQFRQVGTSTIAQPHALEGKTLEEKALEEKALGGLRLAVISAFAASVVGGLLVPVYTDEVGWRFQERAGFDGVDKMFNDNCGPNTLAEPALFMWPVRWFSALTNALFADPLYVRLSGILYALIWAALLLVLIRRIAESTAQRMRLAIVGLGLLCLANTPFILVLSRPEQPIILTCIAAAIIAVTCTDNSTDRTGGSRWWRPLAVAALCAIALSYHLKALFLLPVYLGAVLFCGRGRAAMLPRLASTGLMVAMAGSATLYWVKRFQCFDDPILRAQFSGNNVGGALAERQDSSALGKVLDQLAANIDIMHYVDLATPRAVPLSTWLPANQIADPASDNWSFALSILWGTALGGAVCALGMGAWRCIRDRRIDARLALALLIPISLVCWSATQRIKNFYEAGLVLPLMALAVVLALSCIGRAKWLGRGLSILAAVVGTSALASPLLAARLWRPSLEEAASARGYLAKQPNSVPVFGYSGQKPDILGAARLCRLPEPEMASHVLVDDTTYFAFMRSTLPQHRLGVLQGWTGSLQDPVAYLRKAGSDGAIVGCHFLPPELRARARQQGQYCCLGPPGW